MAGEKISALVPTATFGGTEDWMLISKHQGGGIFESQKIAPSDLKYDSGWVQIPAFNGSFGMVDIGSVYRPYIRALDREITMFGTYVIPMQGPDPSDPVIVDGASYPITPYDNVYIDVTDGFTLGTLGEIYTSNPIIPANLYPDKQIRESNSAILQRTYKPGGGVERMRLVTIATPIINTNGTLQFNGVTTYEKDGSSPVDEASHPFRELVSRFSAGDKIMDYSNWYNSYTAGGADRRIRTDSGEVHDFDHDANQSRSLGGYVCYFNVRWVVPTSVSVEQVKIAIDSM